MLPRFFASLQNLRSQPISDTDATLPAHPVEVPKHRRFRLTYVSMATGFLVAIYEDGVWKYDSHINMRYATPFTSPKDAHLHANRAAPMLHGFEHSYYTLVQPV